MRTMILVLLLGICTSIDSQWVGLQPGYWGPWTDWSECDKSCGGGTRVRHRECVSPRRKPDLPKFILDIYKEHTQRNCPGSDAEYVACNTQVSSESAGSSFDCLYDKLARCSNLMKVVTAVLTQSKQLQSPQANPT